MSGVRFILEDRLIRQELAQLARNAQQLGPAMNAIGAHFVFSTQRNIERETAPDGTKWKPLHPLTAARKLGRGRSARRRGYDHILRVTARLYQSISYLATDTSVEWGTNVVYGRIHQLGGVVDVPAESRTIWLKSIRRKGRTLTRFARANAKGATSREVTSPAHRIFVPARPYLGISAMDRQAVPEIIADHLRSEAGR